MSSNVSDAELDELPLVNASIEETLRLYGAAPGGLLRIVPPGGATLDGYIIPEGITVSTQGWSLHRDPDNFPNPDQYVNSEYTRQWHSHVRFDPSRWLPDNVEKMPERSKTAYSPLGAGARICLGIHLARMELRLAAALFFREMKGVKLAPGMTDKMMDVKNYFLIAPRGHKCEITLL